MNVIIKTYYLPPTSQMYLIILEIKKRSQIRRIANSHKLINFKVNAYDNSIATHPQAISHLNGQRNSNNLFDK